MFRVPMVPMALLLAMLAGANAACDKVRAPTAAPPASASLFVSRRHPSRRPQTCATCDESKVTDEPWKRCLTCPDGFAKKWARWVLLRVRILGACLFVRCYLTDARPLCSALLSATHHPPAAPLQRGFDQALRVQALRRLLRHVQHPHGQVRHLSRVQDRCLTCPWAQDSGRSGLSHLARPSAHSH